MCVYCNEIAIGGKSRHNGRGSLLLEYLEVPTMHGQWRHLLAPGPAATSRICRPGVHDRK